MRYHRPTHLLCASALLLTTALWGGAKAADITVGLSGTITSLDPHFHNNSSNSNVAEHMFDPLVARDAGAGIVPALALGWTLRGPTTWEFKLRPDVRFHDGRPFTSADVVFSLGRTKTVKNSPSSFALYTRAIKRVVALDKLTVHVHTDGPVPMLPRDLTGVLMVSKAAAENAATEDFNSGRALVGTGPFKFAAVRRNERIDLVRNAAYWGRQGQWDKATILLLPNESTRTAALLSGKVDLIENVPTQDVRAVAARPGFTVASAPSFRLMYLHLDGARAQTPFAFGLDRKPLARNPLADLRVRQAISKAVGRDALVAKVLEGMGVPSDQLVGPSGAGHAPELIGSRQDIAGARRLLAAAGYPNGFRITLHSTSDHYVNDRQVAQTLAGMLGRVGILTDVQSLPAPVYFARGNKLEFSLMLGGWNADSGMVESSMKALLAGFDPATGMGASNRGRYRSAAFDQALLAARVEFDDARRGRLLREANRVAMRDVGLVPLYIHTTVWGSKKGWNVTPRQDGRTYIHQVVRASAPK
ncbi:ABC transporter substrate-binding protein [Massilia glaciei]|nr:ABC transporter substrate-binding protein [Massilia glaciei]